MIRAGELDREEESNEKRNTIYCILNALHSIYLDGPAFGICGEWRSLFDYFAKKWYVTIYTISCTLNISKIAVAKLVSEVDFERRLAEA